MNIGIYIEKFTETEIDKDPGLIALGLEQAGAKVIIFAQTCSEIAREKYTINVLDRGQREQVAYWQASGIDTLIIYSWLSLRYSNLIKAAKSAGLKVILKLDSDGHLIHPLKPSYLRVFGLDKSFKSKIKHIIRLGQWLLIPRLTSRDRVQQLQTCDAVIIETPVAKINLGESLSYWQQETLISKVVFIPNPIESLPNIPGPKENIITCIGRWDDKRKNATGLRRVFSTLKTDWQINLIGHGSNELMHKIKKDNSKLKLSADEQLPHHDIFKRLASSKIFFAPSVAESFNLAAAEALCCGCSFVGGPLPSFIYFANEGQSGSLAADFHSHALRLALENDINKWKQAEYQTEAIKTYWQQELSQVKISEQIINLIKSL